MLSQELGPSPHSIMAALFVFASGSDWLCLKDIYVPLHLWSQSTAIDKALFQHLLSTTLSTRSRALLSALPHADYWLNGVPSTTLEWVFTFRTRNLTFYTILAWSDSTLLLLLLPWMPQYSWSFWRPPSWLWGGEWRQDHQAQCHSRCRLYSAAQSAALAVVTNLISDSLQTSWCLSSHLELWLVSCSWCTCGLSPPTTLWEKQHPLLAVPCKLVLSASCPPTAWHAD